MRGGPGHPGLSGVSGYTGGLGGEGLKVADATLVAAGTTVEGGAGGLGDSWTLPCADAGDGGPGIALLGLAFQAHQLDSGFSGGAGGEGTVSLSGCTPADGAPGADTLGAAPILLGVHGALALTTTSPVREGGLLTMDLQGPAGAPVFLALSSGLGPLLVPSLSGSLLLQPPYVVLAAGVLDGDGTAQSLFPIGELPPGVESFTYFGQAAYLTPLVGVVLGEASAVLVLDSQF